MITMVLGGLWHGAAWGFVLWGALHGTCLVIEHQLRGSATCALPAWLRWFIVFHVVVLGWILFRAASLEPRGRLHRAARPSPAPATLWTPAVVAAVVVVIGMQLLPPAPLERDPRCGSATLPAPALGVGLAAVIAVVGATVPGGSVPPFIYFQF